MATGARLLEARVRQRVLVGLVATAVQLAGFFILVPFLPVSTFGWFVPFLAGSYLASWLGLALGEMATGLSSGFRKLPIAAMTTAGLIGSYVLWIDSVLHGRGVLMVIGGAAVGFNLLGSWWLGKAPGAPGEPRSGTGLRSGARLVAAMAAGFVSWHVIVESVRLDYAVEAPVIGDMRTLISAQAAYAVTNAGFYDTLECLQKPRGCLGAYPASGPAFLDRYPWVGTVRYYRRRFVAGPKVDPKELPAAASRSSMKTFAYVALPAEPEGIRGLIWRMAGISLRGARAFCADSTGRICASDGDVEPRAVDGACVPECKAAP